MGKNIFILGNGFDLDVGRKTRYSDFAGSEFFEKYDYPQSDLCNRLKKENKINNWFDIEQILLNYAIYSSTGIPKSMIDIDYKAFIDLKKRLKTYLERQQQREIFPGAFSLKVFKLIYESGIFDVVYNFNYTSLYPIIKFLNIQQDIRSVYIHGNLEDDSIILGVDDTKLKLGYEFLHKTSSPYYRSTNISDDIYNADELVIYGLSFGKIDYIYFRDLFSKLSLEERIGNSKKNNITIFTFDEASRMNILNRLRKSDVNVRNVFNHSNLNIIRVNSCERIDIDRYNEFKERIETKSKKCLEVFSD